MNSNKQEILNNYKDLANIITVDKNPTQESTKNGLMHTGYFICLLDDLGILEKSDIELFKNVVESCEEDKGCYDRYPEYNDKLRNNDANAHDDYVGVFSGSVCCNLLFHKEILDHGKKHAFIYNNQQVGKLINGFNPLNWNWWAFRLRKIDDIIWYYLGNKEFRVLSPILMLVLYLKTFKKSITYSVLLDYMRVKSLSKVLKEWLLFKKLYYKRMKLKEATEEYFKKDHPLVGMAQTVQNGL